VSCCDFQERFQADPGLSYDMFLFLAEDGVKGMEGGLMYHHILAELQGALVKMQTVQFTDCFQWCCYHWAHCIESHPSS